MTFNQGFKTICLRTKNIEEVKATLQKKNIDVIGPVRMERENKKGDKVGWQLLYIADPSYNVKLHSSFNGMRVKHIK